MMVPMATHMKLELFDQTAVWRDWIEAFNAIFLRKDPETTTEMNCRQAVVDTQSS